MFVKLESGKQHFISSFEPQENESRAELVGVFLGHLHDLFSDWLCKQMQNPVF